MNFEQLLNQMGLEAFGMTRTEAHKQGVCIKCKCHVMDEDGTPDSSLNLSPTDRREYQISALCQACFDSLAPKED